GFLHRGVDRDVEDRLAGLLGVHARDEAVLAVRVFLALFGVELAGLARDALGDDLGVFVDVDRHVGSPAQALTAATTFWAASAIESALMMGRPDSASIFLPNSSLVPFMRTTSGTLRFTARQ